MKKYLKSDLYVFNGKSIGRLLSIHKLASNSVYDCGGRN
jgi:hypothetical protein